MTNSPTKPKTMKQKLNKGKLTSPKTPEWEREWDEMWFNPQSTVFNWEGMFKEQTFLDKLLGIGVWQDSGGTALKKDLHSFLKDYIRRLLYSQRDQLIQEVREMLTKVYTDETDKVCHEDVALNRAHNGAIDIALTRLSLIKEGDKNE